MHKLILFSFVAALAAVQISHLYAQDAARPSVLKPGVLSASDVKIISPTSYYYAGRAASVQTRNTAGVRTQDGKTILVGMVDTSGYSTGIQQKYQGFFITEAKIHIEGTEIDPGEYGFGFMNDRFILTNVAAEDVLNVPCKIDEQLKRPVPLKVTDENGGYRLYAGKKYVVVQVQ
ncbi:MAG TPA: hypothetical protein VMT53_27965 [Terriglobales bacterium]|nr:hypothetical protein [Terriglobales bacterium]